MLQNDCLVTTRLFDEGRLDTRDETVGHLPREFSRIAWYFLARSGEISVEVIGRRRHCKQLCRGIEIPCQFKQSADETLKRTTGDQDSGIEPADANKQLL